VYVRAVKSSWARKKKRFVFCLMTFQKYTAHVICYRRDREEFIFSCRFNKTGFMFLTALV